MLTNASNELIQTHFQLGSTSSADLFDQILTFFSFLSGVEYRNGVSRVVLLLHIFRVCIQPTYTCATITVNMEIFAIRVL